jgi:hypothetical protein
VKQINSVQHVDKDERNIKKWKELFPNIFRKEIGKMKDTLIELHIDKSIEPKQNKLRKIPIHLRDKVENEIKTMLENVLIEVASGPTLLDLSHCASSQKRRIGSDLHRRERTKQSNQKRATLDTDMRRLNLQTQWLSSILKNRSEIGLSPIGTRSKKPTHYDILHSSWQF